MTCSLMDAVEDRYFLVGSFNRWGYSFEPYELRSNGDAFEAEVTVASVPLKFQIIENMLEDQRLYPDDKDQRYVSRCEFVCVFQQSSAIFSGVRLAAQTATTDAPRRHLFPLRQIDLKKLFIQPSANNCSRQPTLSASRTRSASSSS
eukprot:g7195.t1